MTNIKKRERNEQTKRGAKKLKQQLIVLHLAYQDRRTPWCAKILIFLIIAYALSPIDLIPDFIPIIGYLDDIVLLPIGIYFAIKLIPKNVKRECDIKAKDHKWNKKNSWIIGGIIILFWAWVIFWILKSTSIIT